MNEYDDYYENDNDYYDFVPYGDEVDNWLSHLNPYNSTIHQLEN